jgi:hypothetical protein
MNTRPIGKTALFLIACIAATYLVVLILDSWRPWMVWVSRSLGILLFLWGLALFYGHYQRQGKNSN